VNAVKFHPNSEVVMTCSFDKRLRLYHVDGGDNPLIGSYHFADFPLQNGVFTSEGNACIVTGLSECVYRFDVESGQSRRIHFGGRSFKKIRSVVQGGSRFLGLGADSGQAVVVDEKTNRLVKSVKMNAETRGVAFHPTREVMYTTDSEAFLYEWDLGTGRCITKFRNEADVSSTALAISPDGERLAVGTQSGIVDVFDSSGSTLSNTLLKSVNNITTAITSLCFHPNSEILAFGSSIEKKSLRLLHVPTLTAFQNFPDTNSMMKRPSSFDFSRQGGKFAVGGSNGKVKLYTLNHYQI